MTWKGRQSRWEKVQNNCIDFFSCKKKYLPPILRYNLSCATLEHKSSIEFKTKIMKKLLILSIALLAAISCNSDNDNNSVEEVVIETLEGSTFRLSQFGLHKFPATDSWVIDDLSATTDDFEGLSDAIEYISLSEPERQISIEFSDLEAIPAYAIFGESLSDGSRSFTALTSVAAPYATTVGNYAFEFCYNLASVSLPQAQSVGSYALRDCKALGSLSLPSAISIGDAAFSGCRSLTSLDLPLVESVGEQAFRLCDALTSIELPSATTIEAGAFGYCSALTSFDAEQLLSIGDYAFCGCLLLTDLNIPIVEQIGNCAFISCSSLESFTLNSSLSSLGYGVFSDCTSLMEIICDNSDYSFDTTSGILYNSDQTEAIIALPSLISGELVLPTSVTSLRQRAFYNCYEITSVELPSVVVVSQEAFKNCSSITTATLAAATTLSAEAFSCCGAMASFVAPQLTVIGEYAFYDCEAIVEIAIATASGVALESIDTHAFHSAYIIDTVLTVGAANADYVTYSDTLTVGDFEAEFDSIIVLEE